MRLPRCFPLASSRHRVWPLRLKTLCKRTVGLEWGSSTWSEHSGSKAAAPRHSYSKLDEAS